MSGDSPKTTTEKTARHGARALLLLAGVCIAAAVLVTAGITEVVYGR